MNNLQIPVVKGFFDSVTHTITYVVADPLSGYCAVIDPVLGFDLFAGEIDTAIADTVVSFIRARNYQIEWIVETHAHADHLSAAQYIKKIAGGAVAIGKRINEVQATFGNVFNLGQEFATDGSQFDYLFSDNEAFQLGNMSCKALYTPGHTPACVTYLIGDNAFVGDTLFMPDFGTARTDFPGGDAATLYQSIHRIYRLPDQTKLYMCHDYLPAGRDGFMWECTVAEQKQNNVHISADVSNSEFVHRRNERDKDLAVPRLIYPSIQVNIRAGHLPVPEENNTSYLKIPLKNTESR